MKPAFFYFLMVILCGVTSYCQFYLYEVTGKKYKKYMAWGLIVLMLLNFVLAWLWLSVS